MNTIVPRQTDVRDDMFAVSQSLRARGWVRRSWGQSGGECTQHMHLQSLENVYRTTRRLKSVLQPCLSLRPSTEIISKSIALIRWFNMLNSNSPDIFALSARVSRMQLVRRNSRSYLQFFTSRCCVLSTTSQPWNERNQSSRFHFLPCLICQSLWRHARAAQVPLKPAISIISEGFCSIRVRVPIMVIMKLKSLTLSAFDLKNRLSNIRWLIPLERVHGISSTTRLLPRLSHYSQKPRRPPNPVKVGRSNLQSAWADSSVKTSDGAELT